MPSFSFLFVNVTLNSNDLGSQQKDAASRLQLLARGTFQRIQQVSLPRTVCRAYRFLS